MNERIEMVHALVDGELDAGQREQVTAWVAADPELNREYHWALAMKDLVAAKCPRIEAPASWEAAQKRIGELERARTVNFLVGKHAWGICGVLVVAVLAAGAINQLSRSTTVSAVQAADMIRTPWSGTALSTPNYKTSPYFVLSPLDGSQIFRIASGVQVEGQGIATTGNRPVVVFGLHDSEGPMTLHVIRDSNQVEGFHSPFDSVDERVGYSDFKIGFINQHPSVSWKKDQNLIVLTSDRGWDRLVDTAKRLR